MKKLLLTAFGLVATWGSAWADTLSVQTLRDGLSHVFLTWDMFFMFYGIVSKIV